MWVTEETWAAAVDAAAPLDAEVTLLHVAPADVEALAAPGRGLLGRRPPPHREPTLRALSDDEATALLAEAAARLGRPAATALRRGRAEHEVVEAARDFDVLVLARDGDERPGPRSLGKETRFVVDHAPASVLLVW